MSKSNAEKIQYIIEAEREMDALKKQLRFIEGRIDDEQFYCSHVYVSLIDHQSDSMYLCLRCGEVVNHTNIGPEYIVHAENYLPHYDVSHDVQRAIKIDCIRRFALDLLKDKTDISREELAAKLNNLIQESISIGEGQNFVKSKGSKK